MRPRRPSSATWGPGKYDPRHHAFDGKNIISLNSPSLPIVIPPIYALKNVGFETFTADGPISYWNAYVGVGQMGGQGNFSDPRIGLTISQTPDLVTPKLPALLAYQLSLRAPKPTRGSFDAAAAARGKHVFRNEARCASCHQGPTLTDVLNNRFRGDRETEPFLHDPSTWVRIRRMRRGPRPASIGPRHCAVSSSIHRTSMMAVRPPCPPSSITTSSCSG